MAASVEQAVERAIERTPVFDLRDGSIVHGPATQPQAGFDTRVRGGRVEIRLAPQTQAQG